MIHREGNEAGGRILPDNTHPTTSSFFLFNRVLSHLSCYPTPSTCVVIIAPTIE